MAQDQFVGEIRIFAGTFAPTGWALCDGQILSISSNTALFSILGTTYGGNGQTTFALPNLNGRVPIGTGSGPGLTPRVEGETGGQETVTLLSTEMPAHSHTVTAGAVGVPCYTGVGNSDTPENSYPASSSKSYTTTETANASTKGAMNTTGSTVTLATTGGGQPHNNLQPYLVVRYIIALQGIYPARN
jgi:Microcystin-dependent protein